MVIRGKQFVKRGLCKVKMKENVCTAVKNCALVQCNYWLGKKMLNYHTCMLNLLGQVEGGGAGLVLKGLLALNGCMPVILVVLLVLCMTCYLLDD